VWTTLAACCSRGCADAALVRRCLCLQAYGLSKFVSGMVSWGQSGARILMILIGLSHSVWQTAVTRVMQAEDRQWCSDETFGSSSSIYSAAPVRLRRADGLSGFVHSAGALMRCATNAKASVLDGWWCERHAHAGRLAQYARRSGVMSLCSMGLGFSVACSGSNSRKSSASIQLTEDGSGLV